jgi:hypothetical protein
LAHKLREAMAAEVKGVLRIGGEGRKAEIDGGYFGGYVEAGRKPAWGVLGLSYGRASRRAASQFGGLAGACAEEAAAPGASDRASPKSP